MRLLVAAFWLMGFSFLDEVARKVERGNQHFDQEEFEAALEAYREAQTDRPDAPELHYNVGDALYKQGDLEQARAAFEKAIESGDSDLAARAYYNLGNAHYRQQTFDQAVGAYEKALELNPDDEDAKVNLEMALQQLEQQQQQNQGTDQQDQDQEQDDQDQQSEGENEESEDQQENTQQGQDDQDQNQQNESDQQQQNGQQDEDQDGQQQGEAQAQPGELSPEEAERLLDAMKDRETESQKRRRVRLQGERYRGKPW